MPSIKMLFILQIIVVLLLANICSVSFALKGSRKDKISSKTTAAANKKDVALVACSACTSLAYVLHDFVSQLHAEVAARKERLEAKEKRSSSSSKHVLEESKLAEVLDSICDPDSVHGEWLRHWDIVEVSADDIPSADADKEYRKLTTQWHENPGRCGVECRTLARSCELLLEEEVDLDELQAYLYRYPATVKAVAKSQSKTKSGEDSAEELSLAVSDHTRQRLCEKMTPRCRQNKAYIAESYVRDDEVFEEMSEKDLQMERLMAHMRESGMGGVSAYGKDDIDALAAQMADGYGDEGDSYRSDSLGEL
jgi:hypothetical protein